MSQENEHSWGQEDSSSNNIAQQFAIQRSKNSEVDLANWFESQTGHKLAGNASIQALDSGRRVVDDVGDTWTIYKTGNERIVMKGLNMHSTPPTRSQDSETCSRQASQEVSGTSANLIGFTDQPFSSESKDIFEVKIEKTKVLDRPVVIFNELFDGQKAVTLDILKKVRFFEIDAIRPDKNCNDVRKNYAIEYGNTYLVLKDIHGNILFSLRGWTVDKFFNAIKTIDIPSRAVEPPLDVTPVDSLIKVDTTEKGGMLTYLFDVMSFSWFWKK